MSLLSLGMCQKDGSFVLDEDSLLVCSNGYAFHQFCPPGSKNSGKPFSQGDNYNTNGLCDINLLHLNQGYGDTYYSSKN